MFAVKLIQKYVSHDSSSKSAFGMTSHFKMQDPSSCDCLSLHRWPCFHTWLQCMQGFIHTSDRAAELASMQHHVLALLSMATQADGRRSLSEEAFGR